MLSYDEVPPEFASFTMKAKGISSLTIIGGKAHWHYFSRRCTTSSANRQLTTPVICEHFHWCIVLTKRAAYTGDRAEGFKPRRL